MNASPPIHALSACELLAHLERGELSSREIVDAYLARIEVVDRHLNAYAVRWPDKARRMADAADAARRAGDDRPLLGLPISIKENIDVEGADSTMGLRARAGQPSPRDAVVVARLREAGAVFLGKTNVSQALLAQEADNALYGVTLNPWRDDVAPGGSSGGEAAAIAAGLSPLGIGTDIGGSIRIPAHFCGIAGFKPTVDRWSMRGSHGAIGGQELVRSQMGPLARCVDDLILAMRVVDPMWMAARDPGVPALPFEDPDAVDLAGLRIGWFDDDGFLTPAASLRRAVARAREALEAAGATVVPFTPVGADEIVYVWLAALSSDGGRALRRSLAGEPPSPQLQPTMRIARLPAAARRVIAAVLDARGDARIARLLRVLGEKRVVDYWDLVARRTSLRLAEFDAWRAANVDVVLCPAHSVPAMPHRSSGDFTLSLSYTFRYALMNFPAGVVPVTRVNAEEASAASADKRAANRDGVDRRVAEIEAGGAGLPVGVQVVSRPWREHIALAVMRAIETHVRDADDYPVTPVDV